MRKLHLDRYEIATVFDCQQCGRSWDSVQARSARLTCPYCGKEGIAPPATLGEMAESWVDVARVTNLAEAGFLADDLQGAQIDARILESEDFNAAGGSWATAYLLQVPTDLAPEAAMRIRRHMVDEEANFDRSSGPMAYASEIPFDSTTWRPLAFVLLASVASFVVGQRFATLEGQRRPAERESLSAAVGEIGRPLLTEPMPGKPRYRLSYDWRRDAWLLDADRDGDGRFEHRKRFKATGAAW